MSTADSLGIRFVSLAACALFVLSCGGAESTGPAPATPAVIALVSGDSQSVTSGTAFGQPLVVRVTAASAAAVPGITVTFQVTSGSGGVNPGTAVTNASGLAQTTVTAGATAGPLVITASVSGLTQTVSAHLTVQPQPPAAIAVVSGDSQSVTSGAAFGQPLVAEVTTASGAGIPGVTVTFQVTSGSGGVNPGTAVTNASGRAQTMVTAGATAGPLVLTASTAALTQTASAHFTVQAPPTQFAGRWVGTTSQSRALTLWIGPAGVMDSLQVQISVPIPGSGSCLVPFTPANISLGGGGSFSATLFSPTTQVSGTLSGTFPTATTASGTFQAGWSGGMICGSTIVFGGSGSSTGTWQATKSPMSVSSVSPNNGPLAGGTNVTITGWFEAPVDSVLVGTGRLGNLVRVSSTRLTGTTPAGVAGGAANVTVYAGAAASGTCTGCFTYNPAIIVDSVSPNSGSVFGGTPVTITGTNFPTTVDSVRVGTGRLGSVVRVSGTQLTGITPEAATGGIVDVVVYATSAGHGSCSGCFTFNPPGPLTVSAVSPASGPLAGGTTVTITGTDFPPAVDSVRVGTGRLGSVVRVSGTRLTGITPASSAAGAVNVTVYTASQGSGGCTGCFTFNPAITVSGVSPASGRLAGGTTVTITGMNFPTTVDSVRVGVGRLGSVVRVSGTQLTGITPASSVFGAVDVVVYATSAGNGNCAGCFTYSMTVSAVNPASGPLAGGMSVTITGTDFPTAIDSVRVGVGRIGGLVRVSATQLTGTTPAGSAVGAVNVTVYAASAGSGGCTGCFTYNPAITVSGVSPARGPLAGGTLVTITGTNFPAVVDSIRFGTALTLAFSRTSETQLVGITPGGSVLGAVDVTVFSTSAGSGSCTGCFTYYPPVTWASLTAGVNHTCGLTSGAAAYCWGRNFNGQLGDSSTAQRTTAVAVAGGLTFASLTAGNRHTCGLTSGGVAYCWGYNLYRQLGDGSATQRTMPVAVAGGLTFARLAAGDDHTCGVTSGGAAHCWGSNSYGQLGDGSTTTYRGTPVAVAGGLTFASLTAGGSHTCGLTGSGIAYCWGDNFYGQLGDSSTTQRTAPVAVAGGLSFASLTAGRSYTCGLTSGGAAYCWGSNSSGQLGDGSTTQRTMPVAVTGGLTFASLVAGGSHTCGLTSGGMAYCWGYNLLGQLGDGSTTQRTAPVAVAGGRTFASLVTGSSHTCGPASSGTAYCWGFNAYGQLGDGSLSGSTIPVAVLDP